ncbi:MAG: hypothetical protein ACHQAW_04810 [Actinomycetota bacterium]|jgi:uncharacterized membrane protein
MEQSDATLGRGIAAFVGRALLGIVTCGVLGLAFGLVFKLVQDPNCENDCDILWYVCTIFGFFVGVLVGLFVALEDRRTRSRGGLRVLVWAAGVGLAAIFVALLLGAARTPPVA